MVDYSCWNSFNVEEVLKKIDEEDAANSENLKKIDSIAKEAALESKILKEATFTAEFLRSQANVTALKIRQGRKRGQCLTLSDLNTVTEKAITAETVATGLIEIINCRDDLRNESYVDENELAELFSRALERIKIIKELLEKFKSENSVGEMCKKAESCSSGSHRGCSNEKQATVTHSNEFKEEGQYKLAERLHLSISILYAKNCLKVGKMAMAAHVLRDVLFLDKTCIEAWILRSNVFYKEGVLLLSLLHVQHALKLDSKNVEAVLLKDSIEASLKSKHDLPPLINQDICRGICGKENLEIKLKRGLEIYKMGIVLYQERFFQSSTIRFQNTIALFEPLMHSDSALFEERPDVYEALREVLVGSYLNIAAGNLVRNIHYSSVIQNCDEALKLDPNCECAFLYRASTYQNQRDFSLAISDLHRVKEMLRLKLQHIQNILCEDDKIEHQNSEKEREISMKLKCIKKRIEHIEFLRSHMKNIKTSSSVSE